MGRFINCFILVILKFKMATNDHIGSNGMVILHKMQSTAIGTVVDLIHCFNDLLLSMTREYDEIILVFDTYNGVSLKYATREARLQGHRVQCSTISTMKRASNILP